MRQSLLLAFLAASLHAATIRGIVVEKQTGRPLARALVVAQPIVGSKGATKAGRANSKGLFEIPDVPAGLYPITASRTGFASVLYGQKHWYSAGTPATLASDTDLQTRFALPHFGAITGRVVDENNVGIPGCKVVIFRNTRPPEMLEQGLSDDRGAFRISGLSPGTYLVRTAELANDIGYFLPTFSRESQAVNGSLTHDAVFDQDTLGADVRPVSGNLFPIAGYIRAPARMRLPSSITLVSDMGSQFVSTPNQAFRFERLAPGTYELYIQSPDPDSTTPLSGYATLDLDHERGGLQFDVDRLMPVRFSFIDAGGQRIDPTSLPFLMRRRELSGPGKVEYLKLDDNSQMRLGPGHWEFSLGPNEAWYTAKFSGPAQKSPPESMNGWNEIVLTPGGDDPVVTFTLAPRPATIRGIVTSEGVPVPGAPVHLEVLAVVSGRRILELRTTRTDVQGRYSFVGLAPGFYRIAATFEYSAPDTPQMTRAQALEIKITDSEGPIIKNLPLWSME